MGNSNICNATINPTLYITSDPKLSTDDSQCCCDVAVDSGSLCLCTNQWLLSASYFQVCEGTTQCHKDSLDLSFFGNRMTNLHLSIH